MESHDPQAYGALDNESTSNVMMESESATILTHKVENQPTQEENNLKTSKEK